MDFYGKLIVQINKTLASSSSSSSPFRNWEHDIFVSFRGEDVRTSFLSHILKEFRRKGINPFMDNGMKKGASISPELKRAIKGSKIAIVLLSKNYASSSWCLNELVNIIKCRKKIGQKVITIFYQVEPTDVKKQTGKFGKIFKKTCKDKTYDVIRKWRESLVEVGTIIGYDSTKWPKHEWIETLPNLRSCLDGKIDSTLMFSYDVLSDECKDLFLHIACFFNFQEVEKVEAYLAESFMNVRQGFQILVEKSLIYFENGYIKMHKLLAQLGKEIVRKQYGKRQFLVGAKDTNEILNDNTTITGSVVGIHLRHLEGDKLTIRERAFRGMHNLQFLIFKYCTNPPCLFSLIDISSKLRLLDYDNSPMTCWPTTTKLEFIVELNMPHRKLEKLWEGIKPLQHLKWLDLSFSKNLRELPNFSTATSLKKLNLRNCSSLVDLPSSIGNATNFQDLNLTECSSLVDLPCSIGNATNLQKLNLRHCSCLLELPCSIGNAINLQTLDLSYCSSLVELPFSIGNATNLQTLDLSYCSSLVELPSSIGNLLKVGNLILRGCSKLECLPTNMNMERLEKLDLTDCLLLKTFPEISTNIKFLYLIGTAVKEVPSSIRSWSHLHRLCMPYSERFMEMSHALDTITKLDLTDLEEIQKLGTWIKGFTRLRRLVLNGMRKLVSIPQLPDFLFVLDAENCESLERLDCSFYNPGVNLNFRNCFRLNQEARDLIIQTSTYGNVILPGGEVPTYFNYRAFGNISTVKLNEKAAFGTSRKYRACVLLVNEGFWNCVEISCVASKYDDSTNFYRTYKGSEEGTLSENLFIFNVDTKEVTSTELVFEFKVRDCSSFENWKIKECGVVQLSKLYSYEDKKSWYGCYEL